MAAGLGFKDFQTGEVLTAADVDGYLMQGIWVFDDATARDAAVTSPQEGNACYLKDTNEVLTYSGSTWVAVGGGSPLTTKGDLFTFSTTDARLAVGANGTTLVADSSTATGLKWDTPASGGMTLISTTTLSGATTTISSIPATYNDLRLVIRNYLPADDGAPLYLRFNADDGANRHKENASYGSTTGGSFDSANALMAQANDNTTAQGLIVTDIFDYANTVTWKMFFTQSLTNNQTTATNFNNYVGRGMYNQTSAISSLLLLPGSGNFTSGTALLYGVK
jgi:hypothetical protein